MQRRARRPPAPRRCLRTATAGRGRCRAAARPLDARRDRARQSRRATRSHEKCPTPGTTMARRAVEVSERARRAELGAGGREALAHRREVAGAVVDEGNHNRPLVVGRALASRRPSRTPPQRARERLEHRFDLVVARPAVQHLQVHVGARAWRSPRRSPARAPSADRRRVGPSGAGRRRRARGREIDRGHASVSSIGITK